MKNRVTDEQIKLWKAKHRKVKTVTVTDDGERFVGYFHRPDMDVFAAVNKLRKTDEVKGANSLFDNCWLGGSTVMREDAVVKMAAIARLNAMLEVEAAEIKNS